MFLLKRLDDAEARRSRPGGGAWQRTQPGRPLERPDRAKRSGTAGGDPGRPGQRWREAGRDRICRNARNRHASRRSDRVGPSRRCLPRADRAANPFSSARSRASSATPKPRPAPRRCKMYCGIHVWRNPAKSEFRARHAACRLGAKPSSRRQPAGGAAAQCRRPQFVGVSSFGIPAQTPVSFLKRRYRRKRWHPRSSARCICWRFRPRTRSRSEALTARWASVRNRWRSRG